MTSTTNTEVDSTYAANNPNTFVFIPDGENETVGVWDYGLGSILHYVKYHLYI